MKIAKSMLRNGKVRLDGLVSLKDWEILKSIAKEKHSTASKEMAIQVNRIANGLGFAYPDDTVKEPAGSRRVWIPQDVYEKLDIIIQKGIARKNILRTLLKNYAGYHHCDFYKDEIEAEMKATPLPSMCHETTSAPYLEAVELLTSTYIAPLKKQLDDKAEWLSQRDDRVRNEILGCIARVNSLGSNLTSLQAKVKILSKDISRLNERVLSKKKTPAWLKMLAHGGFVLLTVLAVFGVLYLVQ